MSWIEDLGLRADETITLVKIREAARIHRDKINKHLAQINELIFDKETGRPVLEKELEYFEDLCGKYPNPTFMKKLRNIRQFLNYFEMKDELQKITEAERDGVLKIFETVPEKKKEEKKEFVNTF